jgi:adenylate kinase family enzyme
MPITLPKPGRRIVVVGTTGAGKTFVAQRLAERLGVPFICNDAIIWGPNWTPTPKPIRFERFDQATRAQAWTIDGNIGAIKDPEDGLILQRADTILWLDLPRLTVMSQLFLRTMHRMWTREELWHGNRERFHYLFVPSESILWWSLKTHGLRRRQYRAIFADPRWSHLIRIRFTSRRQVTRWLAR